MKERIRILFSHWVIPFLFTVAGLAAINLVWLIPAIQNIRSSASLFALEVADRFRSNMEFGLQESLNELNAAADEIAAEPDRATIDLNRFLKTHSAFRTIALTDKSGKEFIRLDRTRAITPNDLKDHSRDPYFYLALQNVPNIWNAQLSADIEPYTTIAVPIKQSGGTDHVLIADLDLNHFVQAAGMTRLQQSVTYVVDRNGFQILHTDSKELAKHRNIADRPIVRKVVIDGRTVDGLSPEDSYINDTGQSVFVVGVPIPLAGWGVFIEQPRAVALGGERIVIVFAVVASLLGIMVVFIIIRGNYRLGRLNNQLNDFLKENYEVGKILVRRDIELTEANNRLMALDASKSEFVSIAAHQLRTPITGIRWTFNALLDKETGELNGDQEKMLEDGLKSSIRMIDLINDLLNVARIEEGRFGFQFKKQPFGLIMEAAVERHHKAIEEKGIMLFIDVQAGLPALALDEEKINIALDNMLDNAIKYTSPGGSLTIKMFEEKGDVHTVISDTGIGIPHKQLERLFTKFFRADNALRFQTSGSGLGLYVVKNIIESHGGMVSVQSEENKGTSISFTIPIPIH